MKYLLCVSTMMSLMVSASASAWWDNNYSRDNGNNNWHDNSYYDGRHHASGDTSRDGLLQGDVQFNMKLRGDADGYVYGNLRNGSENIYFDCYYNNYDGSNFGGVYRNGGQPNVAPYYGPGHDRRYMEPQR
jgi:hypothetical protein